MYVLAVCYRSCSIVSTHVPKLWELAAGLAVSHVLHMYSELPTSNRVDRGSSCSLSWISP